MMPMLSRTMAPFAIPPLVILGPQPEDPGIVGLGEWKAWRRFPGTGAGNDGVLNARNP